MMYKTRFTLVTSSSVTKHLISYIIHLTSIRYILETSLNAIDCVNSCYFYLDFTKYKQNNYHGDTNL